MGQQNKTVDKMSYSTTKEDLQNKLEALRINFLVLNKKRKDADTVLSEVNTFLDSYPEDIEYKVKKNEVRDRCSTITANLTYILNQMDATKKAIDNLDVGKAHYDWLHTPENIALDRKFNSVMACFSTGLKTDPEIHHVATDEDRCRWQAEVDGWSE